MCMEDGHVFLYLCDPYAWMLQLHHQLTQEWHYKWPWRRMLHRARCRPVDAILDLYNLKCKFNYCVPLMRFYVIYSSHKWIYWPQNTQLDTKNMFLSCLLARKYHFEYNGGHLEFFTRRCYPNNMHECQPYFSMQKCIRWVLKMVESFY